MGAADAVPGVSGGTVAFITGIYQELIGSLSKLGPAAVKVLFTQGISAAWRFINGSFLLTLAMGMLTSLVLLSNIVLYLLAAYPQMLWGFFFGLICASSLVLSKSIENWDLKNIAMFILGGVSSYVLTGMSSSVLEPSLINVFFAGMVAICAMILPGVSGAFILLMLGLYSYILGALKSIDILIIVTFAAGCFSGLLCFSKVLNWLFSHYKNLTMALLTGFLAGSLNKVWPWKETLSTRINSHGEQVADLQQNISPLQYQQVTDLDAQLAAVLALALLGAGLVLLLDKIDNK
ncbi:MAG: DUF368 domain-containing protein [Oceanospirillaceae bacterium]|nr:DUF368 domain-containing protein [Oceanospirillaceae bacterium]